MGLRHGPFLLHDYPGPMLTLEQAFPTRVAGVIRSDDPEVAFRACMAAIEEGIATIEVTTTVPSCFDIVRGLVASTGGAVPVGVGTVWRPEQVGRAKAAGAAFIVTPALVPEVALACVRQEIVCVLGALTPTEIHQALRTGAHMVKVFPVASAGGPDYIRLLQGPMGDAPLWVSGGVEIDQVNEYLSLGVRAVGLTTALFPPEALRRGDIGTVGRIARHVAASTGAVRA